MCQKKKKSGRKPSAKLNKPVLSNAVKGPVEQSPTNHSRDATKKKKEKEKSLQVCSTDIIASFLKTLWIKFCCNNISQPQE